MEQTQVTTLLNTPLSKEFFSLAVLLLSSYGIGNLLKTRYAVVKFACGAAILSFIAWSVPSLAGRVVFTTFAILLAITALAGLYALILDIKHEKIFFLSSAVLFLIFLGSGLLLPYSWDECVYQTALLKHYISAGNHAVLPDNPFSYFPSLPHSLMRLGMEITGGGIRLARMLSCAVMAIALGGIIRHTRRYGGMVGIILVMSAVISPIVLVTARANYAEQYILLFAAAGLIALEENRKAPVKCAAMVSLFAAAALSVKLTGAGAVLVLAGLYLSLYKKKNFIYGSIVGILFFALFCLPFFLRPYLASGNPFFPFCDGLFTDEQTRILVSEHHHLLGSYRYGTDFISGLLYGWLFTAADPKIYDGIAAGWQFPLLAIANILLTVILFKCCSIRKKTALLMLGASFVLYIFWAATSQQSRFMLPLLMLNAAICGFMCKGIARKHALAVGMIALFSALAAFPVNHLKHFVTAWKIAPEISRNPTHFLAAATRDRGYFEAVKFLETTPENSKVLLLLNERRTLYMPRKAVIGEPYFQAMNTPVPNSSSILWNNIKNFDYVLVSSANKNPDAQESTSDELLKLAGLVSELKNEGRIQLVFSDKSGEYFIFRCGETATGAAL